LGAKVSFKKHGKWIVQPVFDKWKTTPAGLQLPFTSTEVVYGVTGTEVTELPEYGVSP
jgi:hypothetical protein